MSLKQQYFNTKSGCLNIKDKFQKMLVFQAKSYNFHEIDPSYNYWGIYLRGLQIGNKCSRENLPVSSTKQIIKNSFYWAYFIKKFYDCACNTKIFWSLLFWCLNSYFLVLKFWCLNNQNFLYKIEIVFWQCKLTPGHNTAMHIFWSNQSFSYFCNSIFLIKLEF